MSKSIPADQIEIQALSQDLINRLLEVGGRHGQGQLSAEFRRELVDALDLMVELSAQAAEPEFSYDSLTCPSAPQTVPQPSAANSDSAVIQLSPQELERLVNRAVSQSLADWQPALPIAPGTACQPDKEATAELELVVRDLEGELSTARQQLLSASNNLAETLAELEICRGQLEVSLQHSMELEFQAISANRDDKTELQLQAQLDQLLAEVADLRMQNSDLASQLAQRTASAATATGRSNQEQMSWEDRKLLILKQLESDGSPEVSGLSCEDKLSVKEIIKANEIELRKRDEQIDELREIISLQSSARDGVAVGAAGVASLLDSDELVQQERQKLREIQQEWEAKLRQAEIDLSMERAKIARERSALEKQKAEVVESSDTGSLTAKKERRWLSALGLGEESAGKAKG
jgi:hypothetical protein